MGDDDGPSARSPWLDALDRIHDEDASTGDDRIEELLSDQIALDRELAADILDLSYAGWESVEDVLEAHEYRTDELLSSYKQYTCLELARPIADHPDEDRDAVDIVLEHDAEIGPISDRFQELYGDSDQ